VLRSLPFLFDTRGGSNAVDREIAFVAVADTQQGHTVGAYQCVRPSILDVAQRD